MGTRFTRHEFLAGVGAGATYLALANTVGCEPAERILRAKPAQHGRAVDHGSRPSSEHGRRISNTFGRAFPSYPARPSHRALRCCAA